MEFSPPTLGLTWEESSSRFQVGWRGICPRTPGLPHIERISVGQQLLRFKSCITSGKAEDAQSEIRSIWRHRHLHHSYRTDPGTEIKPITFPLLELLSDNFNSIYLHVSGNAPQLHPHIFFLDWKHQTYSIKIAKGAHGEIGRVPGTADLFLMTWNALNTQWTSTVNCEGNFYFPPMWPIPWQEGTTLNVGMLSSVTKQVSVWIKNANDRSSSETNIYNVDLKYIKDSF